MKTVVAICTQESPPRGTPGGRARIRLYVLVRLLFLKNILTIIKSLFFKIFLFSNLSGLPSYPHIIANTPRYFSSPSHRNRFVIKVPHRTLYSERGRNKCDPHTERNFKEKRCIAVAYFGACKSSSTNWHDLTHRILDTPLKYM